MIEKIGYIGQETIYSVQCDKEGCSFGIDIEEFDFNDLLDDLREKNWVLTKVNNHWKHFCPSCSKK